MAFMDTQEAAEPELTLDLREEDRGQLLGFLQCASCADLAEDAVETLCCHTLLCCACLETRLDRICPTCGRGCSHAVNHLARRVIGSQPWRCRHCGAASSRYEAAEHNRLCTKQPRSCPAPGCPFSGLPDAFLDHLVAAHPAQLLRRAGRLFGLAGAAPSAADAVAMVRSRNALAAVAALDRYARAPGTGTLHRFYTAGTGRDASRTYASVSGKNYCGGRLNGPPCDCCDGNCGPSNGCNCVDCMRRDLATFHVSPGARALVNREGVIATVSSETSKFYCGRPNMGHDRATDGFCGPSNGNNCHACHQLDGQARNRYAAIVNSWS